MLFFKRFGKLLKNNMNLYIGALIATVFASMVSLLGPLVIKITIDSIIAGSPIDAPAFVINVIEGFGGISFLARNLWICSIALFVISVCEGVFMYLRGRFSAIAAENMAKTLKDRLYDHLQKLPYDYHVKAQTGDLIQRCTSDVETIRKFVGGQVIEIGRTLCVIIFSVSIMLTISVKMTLVSIIIVPIIFLFSYIFFVKVKATFKLSDEKEGELSSTLQENLSGVRVVRAFGRAQFEMDKFDKKNTQYRDLSYKVIELLAYFWSLSDLVCFAQLCAVLVFGIHMTISGEMTLGSLLVFNSYEGMLLWPVRQLGRILSDMGKTEVSLARVYEILDTPMEKDTPGAVKADLKGDICFRNVNFGYESNKPVLRDMSFSIKMGETIAVLGTTGSGKSTLMHILLRLYDYSNGSITINGTELRDIEKKWLRENVGIVLQEPFLFSKTIKENIKMARDVVEDEEIYDACNVASVHNVIESFDKSYDTIVGEKGVTLSGGQKQRVAIARTLIKNSSILIFDDSLSAVDTETDAQIRQALKERSRNITTFIISQRITTLKEADRIFIIEDGRLSDSGTHDELISRDGLYLRIWNIQNMLEDDFAEEAK